MNSNPTRRSIVLGGLAVGADFVFFGGCQAPNETTVWRGTQAEPEPPHQQPYYAPYRPAPVDTGPGLVDNGLGRANPAPRLMARQSVVPMTNSDVIARTEWTTARPNMRLADPMNGVKRITVHHSAVLSGQVQSQADAVRMLQSVRNGHIGNGWADIGYHYIIDPTGRIWEGRPVSLQGAHVKNQNEHNLGVMVMGNFETERPTPAALASLDRFVLSQMHRFNVPLSRVFTHRELGPTACPGRSLQAHMVAVRRADGRLAIS